MAVGYSARRGAPSVSCSGATKSDYDRPHGVREASSTARLAWLSQVYYRPRERQATRLPPLEALWKSTVAVSDAFAI